MSHAVGHLIREGAVIGYFEFDGNSDNPLPQIRDTEKEIGDGWRPTIEQLLEIFRQQQACTHKPEMVTLWADYGGRGGMHWQHPVCLECKLIMNHDVDITDIWKRGYPNKKRARRS